MDISRIVLALRPDPDVVGRTVAQIFHNIEHESADPERREALEAFFRELSRLVINWMAGSDQTVLRAVHSRIVEALGKLPPSHPANRYLSDGEWLGVRLRGLAVLVSTYFNGKPRQVARPPEWPQARVLAARSRVDGQHSTADPNRRACGAWRIQK